MENTYFVDIEKLSPTQYYLSQNKLKSAEEHFETHALEDYPPFPIMKLGEKMLLIGGHHFAYYISTQGKLIAKVYEESEYSNFFLSLKLSNECSKKHVLSIKDLGKKILQDEEYNEKWLKILEDTRKKFSLKPLSGLKCTEIESVDKKLFIANSILTPFPPYFANEFIYKNYIEKVKTMPFLSFSVHNQSIAFVACRPVYENVLEIYMLGIDPRAQSTSLADKIMKEVITLSKRLGKEYITVKVPSKSAVLNAAHMLYDFYEGYGFAHIESLESPWDEKRLCMLLVKH